MEAVRLSQLYFIIIFGSPSFLQVGEARYVESNHPVRPGEEITGEISFEGATSLKVFFHPRCSTPPGTVLRLTAGERPPYVYSGSAVGDAADDEEDEDADGASGGRKKQKKGNWPDKDPLSVPSHKLSYSFIMPNTASAAASSYFGFGITVVAVGMTPGAKVTALARQSADLTLASNLMLSSWNQEMDADLADLARHICEAHNTRRSRDRDRETPAAKTKISPISMPLELLCIPTATAALQYASLGAVPVPLLRMRYALMRNFNQVLQVRSASFDRIC
jgi:hypothetical protein